MNPVKRLVEELDPLLHERGRLAIVSVLAAAPELTFTELRDTLEMTDGNLSVHLQKLEEKGYVAIDKQFVGRRPQTALPADAGRPAGLDRLSRPSGSASSARAEDRPGLRGCGLRPSGYAVAGIDGCSRAAGRFESPTTPNRKRRSIMEVRMAEHLGMCFGVRDAIDLALGLTRQGAVTILGDLVHNPDVVAQLDAAGAVRVRDAEEVRTTVASC